MLCTVEELSEAVGEIRHSRLEERARAPEGASPTFSAALTALMTKYRTSAANEPLFQNIEATIDNEQDADQ